jgi:hypothetical protein
MLLTKILTRNKDEPDNSNGSRAILVARTIPPSTPETRSDAGLQHVDFQLRRWLEPDLQPAQNPRKRGEMRAPSSTENSQPETEIANSLNMKNPTKSCNPPANVTAEYCEKLRSGLDRLKAQIQALYQNNFPADALARLIAEAEESAWQTPFPSLFFTPLAHAFISEVGHPLGNLTKQ